MKKILVATDLSARSDRAVQRALSLAHERHAEVEVLHVVDDDWPRKIVDQMEKSARATLDQQIAAVPQSKEVAVTTTIVRGQDYLEIMKRAEEVRAGLIVIGIHRHSMLDLFRGTTAERIIRFSRTPVLLVRDAAIKPYWRVLVGVDMSVHSLRALQIAAELAPTGEFQLVHATQVPFKAFLGRDIIEELVVAEQQAFGKMIGEEIRNLSERLGPAAPRCVTLVTEGKVREVLRDQITTFKPDLLAIGTHGRTGIALAMLGSVAEDLLADAPVDVLAVKQW